MVDPEVTTRINALQLSLIVMGDQAAEIIVERNAALASLRHLSAELGIKPTATRLEDPPPA